MNNKELNDIKRIKEEYEKKDNNIVDEIKKLDKKAKLPSIIFGFTFGIISSLIMGFGMSIIFKAILPDMQILGYILAVLGIILVSINYPIYKIINNKGKLKYQDKIIELSNIVLE